MQRKHNTTVKIPQRIIKREAERLAKTMRKKDALKEKKALLKEKAKLKAVKNRKKQQKNDELHEEYMTSPFKKELRGIGLIGSGLIIIAIFSSQSSASIAIENAFGFLFGIARWAFPFGLIAAGLSQFKTKHEELPTVVYLGLTLFAICLLGLVNLAVPHTESHALSHLYGGVIGFTTSFFFREYFGDIVATFVLLMGTWFGAKLAFRFGLIETYQTIKNLIQQKTHQAEEKLTGAFNGLEIHDLNQENKTKTEKITTNTKKRFKNELEIVNQAEVTMKKEQKRQEKANNAPANPLGNQNYHPAPKADPMTSALSKKTSTVWSPPPLDIFKNMPATVVVDEKELRADAEKIRTKLAQFGIEVSMKSVHVGPTVTQFTLQPADGVKLTKITTLRSDLALALAAETVRIEAPIRGKSLVGIEIPNQNRATVGMKEILSSAQWRKQKTDLKLSVGRDVAGVPVVADLAKMPHLLIAGKTGSGKSVAMNAFICSLLYNNSPDKLKMIMIDPKRVELSLYNNLPHLLTPVIVEPEKSVSALAWAVAEMNRRYKALQAERVRNLAEYNEKFKKDPEKKEPFVVIIIDELADLMMVAGKDVEAAICRIAQMARAVGMHLMIATQRPSVDVVTGLIKANLPTRVACKVSSGIDSRTIINQVGAEDLLGFGDMLMLDGNSGNLSRIQGLYISNDEIERLTNHIKLAYPEMMMNDAITKQSIKGMAKGGVLTASVDNNLDDKDLDTRFHEAVELVLQTQKASASFMQRRMEIGYARAARILDQMEQKGLIGASRGAKKREIMISMEEYALMKS